MVLGLKRVARLWVAGTIACALALGAGPAAAQGPAPVPSSEARARGCRDDPLNPLLKIMPEWTPVVDETPRVAEGVVARSAVTHEDNPAFHTSHDWLFDVRLDPAYRGLLSDHTSPEYVVEGERVMGMEWEEAFFPLQFRPSVGDRVWMMGRWVFDCGHAERGYRTELHPPQAVAFTRDEATIFSGDSAPSRARITYVYIYGRGGYYRTAVGGRDYEFDVPLAPRPSPSARLAITVETVYGNIAPVVAPQPRDNPTTMHVTYPLRAVAASPDARFGAIVTAGWREEVTTTAYRVIELVFDSVRIVDNHDAGRGDWHLRLGAAGEWFEVGGLGSVEDGQTVAIGTTIRAIVPDDGALAIRGTGWENDCDSHFRKRDTDIVLWRVAPSDAACLIDPGDRLGSIAEIHSAADGFGAGGTCPGSSAREGQRCARSSTRDYEIRYMVRTVATFPAGSLNPRR